MVGVPEFGPTRCGNVVSVAVVDGLTEEAEQ
jgi:hypothetical protein